jgi:hypothetical protein
MTDRTVYQREYMRNKRAKQRESKVLGQVAIASAKPVAIAPTVCEDFTDKQLEQLKAIVRGELENLLTKSTANNVSKLTPKLTLANTANNASKVCPYCGEIVTGFKAKIYCSNVCAKAASRSKSHHSGDVKRFDEFWAIYPSGYRANRGDAVGAWARGGCDAIADKIISDVERRKSQRTIWINDFNVPLGATYLNARPWQAKA